ncbi:MAG TPA: glycosyltransferase family 39 protein, partial [Anaerolineales bacterium]|nr:glycosyltransferase family 39 protein [Anaerolineales bacterium]
VPIVGWGFALAVIGGLLVLWLTFSGYERIFDVFLPLAIYLIAILIWLSVPVSVLKNSFYMPIDSQTAQPFPYSDAGYYDQMAQSLLIGHSYQGEIPTRPLYIFLLTVLHLLFGENYRNIIIGQTFVLAVIPVVLYYLGKKLHSRVAGVIIALFFIFRELTTLLVSSNTRVSNTKTLLVDLPTLLLLLLACLFAIRWLEQKDGKSALLAGGSFGLLLLLRTQSVLVLPFVILAALLVFGWRNKSFYRLTSIFLLGLFVAITPWLIHNYLRTGKLAFDATFQYATIASQYAYSGNNDISNYDFAGKGVGRVLLEFALKDPRFVFGFITNHFLAAQVNGLLALPLIKPYNGLFESLNLYWMNWDGQLEWYNTFLLFFYMVIIALGLGSAWKRWRWIGLLPLGFSLGYALATAVGRFSGWRYDLPADWIWYFYFGIGIAEFLFQAALLFGARDRWSSSDAGRVTYRDQEARPKKVLPQLFFLSLVFAFIGALPWLAEKIAAPRYPDQSHELLEQKILVLPNAPTVDEINAFVLQPQSFLQIGRVLYPRFFSKNDGLSSTNPWASYAIRDYPRLGFLLLNQRSVSVVFPTKKISNFPHAADAIILGCQHADYVEARLIAFPDLDTIYSAAPLTESCSP